MKKIIFATKNKGKLKEIKEILADLEIKIYSMEEVDINIDVVEDGTTFEENAIKKAVEVSKYTDGLVLADDSGLEVDCLNREPGVYTARFGGDISQKEKNMLLLQKVNDTGAIDRSARFVCVIAGCNEKGETFTIRATMEGKIAVDIKGDKGFGYDPIFIPSGEHKSLAQMDMSLKNKISHRGKALQEVKKKLEQDWERTF